MCCLARGVRFPTTARSSVKCEIPPCPWTDLQTTWGAGRVKRRPVGALDPIGASSSVPIRLERPAP